VFREARIVASSPIESKAGSRDMNISTNTCVHHLYVLVWKRRPRLALWLVKEIHMTKR
jgi:hypothetical protein